MAMSVKPDFKTKGMETVVTESAQRMRDRGGQSF